FQQKGPCHVMQRKTSKVKSNKRKWIAKELKSASYIVDCDLRLVKRMETIFKHVVGSVVSND
ncbi:hypothetical protein L914_03232, partial [Phytophthora nicotianae]